MKNKALAVGALSLFAAGAEAAKVVILPIDDAKMLVGARFDFRVEVSEIQGEASDLEVSVGGIPFERVFGKSLARSSSGDGKVELMARDVAFDRTGRIEVAVRGRDSQGPINSRVAYELVRPSTFGSKARNVILFIGDGMGYNTVTAARVVARGLKQGKLVNGVLNMERADAFATVTTSGSDSLITDSANSASAYATGQKTALNALGVYPDNTPDTLDDPRQELITEMVKRARGMSVGIVTTAELFDATPAAFAAHTRRRSDAQAIVNQYADGPANPDVLMGGGSRDFIPQSATGSRRKDARDVIDDLAKKGYALATNAAELLATRPGKTLGLFNLTNMNVYLDKVQFRNPQVLRDFNDQPLLWDMTTKAIDSLSQNPNGFFLMVEGASIDKQLHPLDWRRAIWDTLEMDVAVGKAKEWAAARGDTLVLVTADHAHSNSTYGTYDTTRGPGDRTAVRTYAAAGFPTYQNSLDRFGLPMAKTDIALAVGFGAAPDYYENYVVTETPFVPTVSQNKVAVANPAYAQVGVGRQGNLPPNAGTGPHTVDDVPLYASGPGSSYFKGVIDNTEVFFGMANALGLDLTRAPRPADRR